MTNLTANKMRPVRLPPGGLQFRKCKLAGYTNFGGGSTAFTVYKGAVVFSDSDDTDGYFRDGDSAVTYASTDVFGGIAIEQQSVTASDTADGTVSVTVAVNGEWGFPIASLTQTDIGAVVYAADDDAVQSATSDALAIGILTDVDSTYAWIDITGYAGKVSSTTT